MPILLRKLTLLFSLLGTTILIAQNQDTLKSYNLNEVTISGMLELEPESFITIDSNFIKKSDAASIIDLGKNVPSMKIQTNSRGESLFFFRGAGERQLTLFFDGIPVNIPWDNRIDLSLVPSNTIGEITVLKGVPPAIFGPNAISGVINIRSHKVESEKGEFSIQLGENNNKYLAGSWQKRLGNSAVLLSASYKKSDGYNLPGKFDDTSNPKRLRLNSYTQTKSIFGKVNVNFSETFESGFLISYIDSKKGVPPEIGVEEPRYWKYPLWRDLIIAANGNIKLTGVRSTLSYTFSYTKFNLQIDQYSDPGYSNITNIEKNDDNIFRGRIIFSNILNSSSLIKIVVSGQSSIHKEEFLSGNFITQTYSENLFSASAEYEHIRDKYVLSIGGGYDWIATPKTGDKEPKDGNSDYSLNTAFVYKLHNDLSVRLNLGRKTRFPTSRETFSGALGRFIPNPNLKAEIATSGELSFSYKETFLSGNASFFLSYLSDGIIRITLPDKKFQRINKDRVKTYGAEINGSYRPAQNYLLNFDFTYLNSFAKNVNGDYSDTLEYKPVYSSSLSFDYFISENLSLLTELEYFGEEYGLKEGGNAFQKLPDYLLVSLRASYQFIFGNGYELEFYVRANNLFDRLYYTQFGLPEAGRQFLFGMNLVLK